MSEPLQLFPELDGATEAALRASIERFGVLVPVAKTQHGEILDGYHRSRIADDLGVRYRVDVHTVADEMEAREIARTLNADRRHLSVEQRRHVVAVLREQGHSLRAIAGAVGAAVNTVRSDLSTVSVDTVPDRVVGLDGKSRPSRRRSVVTARNEREAERATAALSVLDGAPAGVLDVKRVERIAREQAALRIREQAHADASEHGDCEIRLGDFRRALDDLEGRVDAIITDPPYESEAYELYEHIGRLAHALLKPDGVLAVMSGTRLDVVDSLERSIGRHMRRRHRGVFLTRGPAWRDHVERVAVAYKPVLIFSHPDADGALPWILTDVYVGGGDDKRFHRWGQSESGFEQIVDTLTRPGELVVDPFLGGGTTAVVCRALGRRFVGCDIDAAAVATTRERLAA